MIHISPLCSTSALFRVAKNTLRQGGRILLYGPYRVAGFMVDSNIAFDQSLRERNSEWGVRDLEWVCEVALNHDFKFEEKIEMPSNNLCVCFVLS